MTERRGNLIYLDNAATTKVLPEIQDYINGTMRDFYGNPSSIHFKGVLSKKFIDDSRHIVAEYIGANDNEIIFTSSGTEANNMALKGFYYEFINKPVTIITTVIEHKSILNTCEFLSKLGCNIKYLAVDSDGYISLIQLNNVCKECFEKNEFFMASIQFANNEIGTIQHIKDISEVVHKYGGILHTDAVQAFPEIKIDVNEYGIDMMSVSGHKFGCPKGIGFLYIRNGINIEPLLHGGKQEFGLRAGTENIPYIVGIRKAVEILRNKSNKDLYDKRNYLCEKLFYIKDCRLNGSVVDRLANNISISFKDVDAESLLVLLDSKGIYVSSGSACNSGSSELSYVLKAINVPDEYIGGSIRISVCDDITYVELDIVADEILNCVESLRMFK